MQEQLGGDAAGEGAIEVGIAIVEGVDHVHRRSDGAGGFVHVAVECRVGVGIDDAGSEPEAGGVDDGGGGGCVDGGADTGDFSGMDPDLTVLDRAMAGGHDSGAAEDDVGGRWRRLRTCEDGAGEDQKQRHHMGEVSRERAWTAKTHQRRPPDG